MEKLQKFRENIWWQLGLLLVIAVVCGSLIGLVWWLSGLNRPANNSYAQIYSANCTYEVDETFAGKTETATVANTTLVVKSTEKIVASDGANLVRVQATSSNNMVKLDMYVVVKDSAAEYLYFVNTNKTLFGENNIKDNKLSADKITSAGGVTITYNAFVYAIKLALEA